MYGKLFESTFTGSMYGSGAAVFAVWGYCIAHTKPDGCVELNPRLVAGLIGEDVAKIQSALEFLQSPDPGSRSKAEDGRRLLKEGEYLYRVVNFGHYRSMRNDEERREYNRIKQAEHRAKNKTVSNDESLTVIDKSAVSAHSDSDSDSDSEAEEKNKNKKERSHFVPPTLAQVSAYMTEKGRPDQAPKFHAYYESQGWKVGKNPMKKWEAAAAGWLAREAESGKQPTAAVIVDSNWRLANEYAAKINCPIKPRVPADSPGSYLTRVKIWEQENIRP